MRLGLWPAIALVVGHTIGVDIFLTPAELIGALASPGLTLGLWAVCSALILAAAFTFAELASRYPLAGGLVLSVLASLLALLIMAPRLYVAMGSDNLFPSTLASVNQVTQSRVRATAFLAILASVFVLVGTFQQIASYFMCTTLTFVALAAAALVAVRRRAEAKPSFESPGYPVTVMLFVCLVLGIVIMVAMNRPVQALAGFAVVLLGIPAHAISASAHARRR